jgi:hypothetical protein
MGDHRSPRRPRRKSQKAFQRAGGPRNRDRDEPRRTRFHAATVSARAVEEPVGPVYNERALSLGQRKEPP